MPDPRRILIVEDDESIRSFLSQALTDEGYEVEQAPNGRDGLSRLEERRPDLILLDLLMPEMDGWAFRAAQRELDGRSDVPVIVMSASRNFEPHREKLGVAALFEKPFDLDELLGVIAKTLSRPA